MAEFASSTLNQVSGFHPGWNRVVSLKLTDDEYAQFTQTARSLDGKPAEALGQLLERYLGRVGGEVRRSIRTAEDAVRCLPRASAPLSGSRKARTQQVSFNRIPAVVAKDLRGVQEHRESSAQTERELRAEISRRLQLRRDIRSARVR